MKMRIVCLMALMAMPMVLCAEESEGERTIEVVKKDIAAREKERGKLEKELRDLKKKPVVRYLESDTRAGNIAKRIDAIEVNRHFECPYYKGNIHDHLNKGHKGDQTYACGKCRIKYLEWEGYVRQIPECEKRSARMDEIKERLDEIKDELTELRKERSELVREQLAEKKAKGKSS